MKALFNWGDFTLHSGDHRHFLINCEDLSELDLNVLARIAAEILPPWHQVEGVPRGGLRFARSLGAYCRPEGELLIVDDVYTTGTSLEQARMGREARGLVIFARGPTPYWVVPLFNLFGPVARL